jgi:outer membrane phospholipase A
MTRDSFFPYGVWRSHQPSTLAGNPSSSDLRFDLQLNLKVLGRGLDNSGIYGGYTQRSLWDLDEDEREYRVETNYEPRVLALVDRGILSKVWDAWPSALAIEVAYVHQSNGWENERSRSWNRVVVAADLGEPGRSTVSGSVRWWAPFRVEDTNHDLTRFAGDGELRLDVHPHHPVAILGHTRLRIVSRYSFDAHGGGLFTSLETSFFLAPRLLARAPFPRPADDSPDAAPAFALLVQWFVGTGESLTDYQHEQNIVRIGIGVL